jgi:dienelactone hydrolase
MKLGAGLLAVVIALASTARGNGQAPGPPDTVAIRSGGLTLRGLLWRPAGRGPFPAVLFNHGSGPAGASLGARPTAIGPLFARHGYVLLFLFRRGAGLSANQGSNDFDAMRRALAEGGREARNRVQLELLDGDELADVSAGLAFLRARSEVDAHRIAVAGHSFGGSLALVLAQRDSAVRAVTVFGAAAGSWDGSPELQTRLRAAVTHTTVPIFLIYAANDHSIAPARVLADDMERAGKVHRVKIYPPFGRTADEGHDFVYRDTRTWEPDVFEFLNEQLSRRRGAP